MIPGIATVLILATVQAPPEPMGRVQLLRSLHALAYVSPIICPGEDQIAIQIFNTSGGNRTNVPAADFVQVEVAIFGRTRSGEIVVDEIITIDGHLRHNVDSIRCVSSAAKRAGVIRFVISLENATYRIPD